MALFWIALIVEIIVLIASAIYYRANRQWFSLIILIADLLMIGTTYCSKYQEFSWTTYIFPFAQVDYSASGYNEGKYYGGWEEEYPQGKGRLTYNHFIDKEFILSPLMAKRIKQSIMKVNLIKVGVMAMGQ